MVRFTENAKSALIKGEAIFLWVWPFSIVSLSKDFVKEISEVLNIANLTLFLRMNMILVHFSLDKKNWCVFFFLYFSLSKHKCCVDTEYQCLATPEKKKERKKERKEKKIYIVQNILLFIFDFSFFLFFFTIFSSELAK